MVGIVEKVKDGISIVKAVTEVADEVAGSLEKLSPTIDKVIAILAKYGKEAAKPKDTTKTKDKGSI